MNVAEIALEGFDPYDTSGCWDTGWSLGGALKSVSRAVKKTAKRVGKVASSIAKNKVVGELTKQAQGALASAGPLGSVAAGALGGMAAVVRGKNLEQIGWSAVEGASPPGIRQAVAAAHRLRRGDPVLKTAIGALSASLEPAGAAAVTRAAGAIGAGASIAQLGAVRRALHSEPERRAFDAAVGTISRASRGARASVPARVAQARRALVGANRALSISDPLADANARRMPAVAVQHVVDRRLAQHPEWAALSPDRLAARLGVAPTVARAAVDRRVRAVRPQRMSMRAIRLLARLAPAVPLGLFRSDAAGFEQSSGEWIYVVEEGDSPYALAGKYAPGGREKAGITYRQLLKANPTYPLNKKKDNFRNFWAGMRLKWPAGWAVPSQAEPVPAVLPVPSTEPTTLPDASASLTATVQAKALLAAWSVSDGQTEPGLTDYGKRAEDLTPSWTSRDKLMLTAFSRWSNATRSTTLQTDGTLLPEHSRELAKWAEQKAKAPALPATGPTTISMPSEVPKLPAATPAPLPEVPTFELPPMVIGSGEGTPVKVDLPPPVLPAPPAVVNKQAAAKPQKKGSALPAVAMAALAFSLI